MEQFIVIFLALLFEATPFLIAGVAIAAVGGPWLERGLASAAMRTPGLGTAAGTSAGMLLPMCDCGSRPLAHRLALAGRREFAVAFLVAAPVINPIVLVTTWLAFRDAELVILRFGITALVAIAAAMVLVRLKGEIAHPAATGEHVHGGTGWGAVPANILREFFELFQFLVLGAALAAAIQVFVDQSVLTETQGVVLSILALMALGFLLSICSSVDAFVIAGLGSALGTGPLLAFLVFGPIVNLKSIPLYLRLFTVPAVVVICFLAFQIVLVSSIGVQLRAW